MHPKYFCWHDVSPEVFFVAAATVVPVFITFCVDPARAVTVALRAVVLFVVVAAVGVRLTVVRPAVAARAGATPALLLPLLRTLGALRVVVALRAVADRVAVTGALVTPPPVHYVQWPHPHHVMQKKSHQ